MQEVFEKPLEVNPWRTSQNHPRRDAENHRQVFAGQEEKQFLNKHHNLFLKVLGEGTFIALEES